MSIAHVASAQGQTGGAGASGNISGSAAASKAFTYTATTAGNGLLVSVGISSTATPTAVTLTATGWSFSQVGGIVGNTTAGFMACFRAYVPNTSLATVTVAWTGSAGVTFNNDLVDEFSGIDPTNFVDASNSATGSGTPTVSVTPATSDTMIWVAANDSATAVGNIAGSAATKGADDTLQDWSEYRQISGGSGVAQSCTVTGSGNYTMFGVAIKSNSPPVIGSVPSGNALATPAFTAKFLFFDTGDHSIGL
jgi:hypothetical protein